MKKQFLLLLLAAFTMGKVSAGTVDPTTAQTVALNFFISNAGPGVNTNAVSAALNYTKTESDGTVDFYVFNITGAKGFVIVTANDNLEPIIAYSYESNFVMDTKSHLGVSDWMKTVALNISAAVNQNVTADANITGEWNAYTYGSKLPIERATSAGPLVTTTWNQEPYYNLFCPYNSTDKETCVTGCVATAMAQIMKYWNYPATGTGSYSYTSGTYGVQSANFGATTYKWASMPAAVTGSANDTAVATLMYQAGVSVAMSYGDDKSGGSGAWVFQSEAGSSTAPCAQNSYHTYFGYNTSTLQGLHASSYTAAAWVTLLQGELNAGRPVEYEGWATQGGHTWVCDGYNTSNQFHMNWGWGGVDNGYYSLTNLNPSPYVFSSDDGALIGIEPANNCSAPTGLASSSITNASATISWIALSSAISYNVEYEASGATSWTTITGVTSASSALSGLAASTTYNYAVATVCSSGASPYSASSSFTTLSNCGTPSGLASSSITANSATVSWGTVSSAISYNLEYKASGATSWTTITGLASNSYPLAGLSAATTYSFAIAATCPAGTGSYSATSSFATSSPCGIASGLVSSAITTSSATVGWGVVSGASSYNLEYKTSAATTWTTVTGITSTSYSLSSLASGTTYDFAVAVVCSAGTSAYSTVATFATLTPCGIPSGLAASSITTTSATLGWAAVSGATSYNLEYKASGATSWTTVTGVTSASYALSGLAISTTYNFAVAAVCASGTSSYSTTAAFSTLSSVTYCTDKGSSQAYEYIKTVTVGSFTNTSGSNGGYGNFTNLTIPLTPGAANTISLTPGFTGSSYKEYWVVYIDYNGNGLFTDAGEKVAEGNGTSAISGSFTVPSGLTGTTRMRVIMQYGAYVTSPCGTYTYGETEDYTVSFGVAAVNLSGSNLNISEAELNGDNATTASIYPNPTSSTVNIVLSPAQDVQPKIEIINVTGQTLVSYYAQAMDRQASIDVSSLPSGVYMVRTIYGNDRVNTEKLIKQ